MFFKVVVVTLLLTAVLGDDSESGSKCHSTWDDNWDKEPGEEHAEQIDVQTVRHLFFVRHGQYNDKAKEDNDRVLTQYGQRQASFVGKRLKSERENRPFTDVFFSTMTRAVQSANLIAKELGINATQMLPLDSIREGLPSMNEDHPGYRIEQAFKTIFHRPTAEQTTDSYELYVCHGNVIRYFVLRALQLPANAWTRMNVAHASVTQLLITANGRIVLERLGDSSHIPASLITYQCC